VYNAKLTPSHYSLFATNKANLDVIDGHQFEANVSVSEKVDYFLLGSDWLEKQGATWNFATGTVTLGDKRITVHCGHRTGICRRVIVTRNCVVPTKHEANVSVRMVDDGVPLPPCEWAIEPQGLGPGVMATHTLFSNSQSQLVARILNNSLKPKSLRANSLLSMAEPVQFLSSTGCETDNLMFVDGDDPCASVLLDESLMPVSSSSQPAMAQTGETELRASTVSMTTSDSIDTDSRLFLQEISMITSAVCCIVYLRIFPRVPGRIG